MRKGWIIYAVLAILSLFSSQVFARSTYNQEKRELFISIVYVDGISYEATLLLDDEQKLVLTNAHQISSNNSDQPASYNSSTGVAVIPYIEFLGHNIAYTANLTLLTSTPNITFKIASINETPVLPVPSSVGTFPRVGFFNQYIAATSDNRMHLTFLEGAGERVFYGSCESSCATEIAWEPTQLLSNLELGVSSVGPRGIGVDLMGNVHILVDGVPKSDFKNAILYGLCNTNCSLPSNWTWLDLSPLLPTGGGGFPNSSRPFMVQPNGRISFLTDTGTYFSCDSSCTSLSNWSVGIVLNGIPLQAMVDNAGITHVMMFEANESLLHYARCESNCMTPLSWEISPNGFLTRGPLSAASLAVTPSGRVFMAYNQGTITVSVEENNRLIIVSCTGSTCVKDLGIWTSFTVGELDEGNEGSWLQTGVNESVALVSNATNNLLLRSCSQDCHLSTSWNTASVIDTSAAISQVIPPDSGSTCQGSSESAAWWPHGGRLGIGTKGIVVVHNPYAIVQCSTNSDPERLPPIGRVISTF